MSPGTRPRADRAHRNSPVEPVMTEVLTELALRMEGVRKVYEVGGETVVALAGADLTVGADEIVALVGPSGSGKTTLCSIAGGLLTPTEGSVSSPARTSRTTARGSSPSSGARRSASSSRPST